MPRKKLRLLSYVRDSNDLPECAGGDRPHGVAAIGHVSRDVDNRAVSGNREAQPKRVRPREASAQHVAQHRVLRLCDTRNAPATLEHGFRMDGLVRARATPGDPYLDTSALWNEFGHMGGDDLQLAALFGHLELPCRVGCDAMAMHVPIRPCMPEETATFGERQLMPECLGMRAHRVH